VRYSVPASYRNQGGPKGWHFPPDSISTLELGSLGIREFWAAERAATTVDEVRREFCVAASSGPDVPQARVAHVNLPVGTVTFLLTDIAGSTVLWQQGDDAMAAAVARHYEILDAVRRRARRHAPRGAG